MVDGGCLTNYQLLDWAGSSAGEHLLYTQGVTGSIPVPPTKNDRSQRTDVRNQSK